MTATQTPEQLKLCAEAVAIEQAEDFYDADSRASFAGMAAALSWVSGEAVPSPIDQVLGEATSAAIERELNASYDVIYRRRPQSKTVTTAYAQGVEATLLWVLGRTDEPPTPLD